MVVPDPGLLDLPPEFIRHNQADPAWLSALPGRLARFAAHWSLSLGRHFPALSYNYVAPASRADGTPCVLKLSRHTDETGNEIAALRLWDGAGAARLLEAEPAEGALLIERLDPGTMLVEVAESDDDAATVIACDVLRRLWRPVPASHDLRALDDWLDAYERNREAITQGSGGFPTALFQRADALRRELLASAGPPTVLHGDMHHFNILRAQRTEWLAIDPKGLAGERYFDVCQFFGNPHEVSLAAQRRRLDIFCAELGLHRQRTKDWRFVHAVLDACWDYEDGNSWQRAVAYAEETLEG